MGCGLIGNCQFIGTFNAIVCVDTFIVEVFVIVETSLVLELVFS